MRVEMLRDRKVVRVGVRDGAQWLLWDEAADAPVTGDATPDRTGRAMVPAFLNPVLLTPARLLDGLEFELAGEAMRANRTVVCARARPRRQFASRPSVTYEFEFDAVHGTLLRRAVFDGPLVRQITEALEIHYGPKIDGERFTTASLGGYDWGQSSPRWHTQPQGGQFQRSIVPPRRVLVTSDGPGAGATVWLTGLPAAGKTTIAHATHRVLVERGVAAHVLDDELIRQGLSSDLGVSAADTAEHARRAAYLAVSMAQAGVTVVVAMVLPSGRERHRARQIHDDAGIQFTEIFVDTPVVICQQRDKSGFYARTRGGEQGGVASIEASCEASPTPELRVNGYHEAPLDTAARIAQLVQETRAGRS
jgi:adenylylsulfate kinase-like enzyme